MPSTAVSTFAGIVAPFTGAWIEMRWPAWLTRMPMVAPFTGAWIEMVMPPWYMSETWSLPSRERGLKSGGGHQRHHGGRVAPFTGAWIEIE